MRIAALTLLTLIWCLVMYSAVQEEPIRTLSEQEEDWVVECTGRLGPHMSLADAVKDCFLLADILFKRGYFNE